MESNKKRVIIIGAGVAGLSAGCYSQMNGFETQIFEKHTKPGGLCTSWQRKGYTIDGCIHWLVGSSPTSSFYSLWEEVGAVQDKEFIYFDEYLKYETEEGDILSFPSNIDILEKHFIDFAPEDRDIINDFVELSRKLVKFGQPLEKPPELYTLVDGLKIIPKMAPYMSLISKWSKISISDFAQKIKNKNLRNLLIRAWYPQFPIYFLAMTLAWLHKKEAGYPIGGSLSFSQSIAKRYFELGGKINYKSPVKKILVKDDSAIGVELEDGSKHYGDIVISAGDLYKTIFYMLDGKYINEKIKKIFEMPTFPPLLYISLGLDIDLKDIPISIMGFDIPINKQIKIGDKEETRMKIRSHNFDPTLTPNGKTLLTIVFNTDYDYWIKLYENKEEYKNEKTRIFEDILINLVNRFPQISNKVEIWDIATPVTFERYTENYRGSFEGWLLTPQNSNLRVPRTLPGLKNFYMAGHWTFPGGGLPTALLTARWTMQTICHHNNKKFIAIK